MGRVDGFNNSEEDGYEYLGKRWKDGVIHRRAKETRDKDTRSDVQEDSRRRPLTAAHTTPSRGSRATVHASIPCRLHERTPLSSDQAGVLVELIRS